jgi:hypothetical protein
VKKIAKLGLAALVGSGIAFATWKGFSHRNRRQDIANALKLAGYKEDDVGRIILTPDAAGIALAYDPNLHDPFVGFRACMGRLTACLNMNGHMDSCVKEAPRCVSATPWSNDPAGDDCCPESCIQEYLTLRKTVSEAAAGSLLARSTCYPGMKEQIQQLGGHP